MGSSGTGNADDVLRDAGLTEADVPPLVDHLDEIANQWHVLDIGDSLTMSWPERSAGRRTKTTTAR